MRFVFRLASGLALTALVWSGVTAWQAQYALAAQQAHIFDPGAARLLFLAVVIAGGLVAMAVLHAPADTLLTAAAALALLAAGPLFASTVWWPTGLPGNVLVLVGFEGTPLLIGLFIGAGLFRAVRRTGSKVVPAASSTAT